MNSADFYIDFESDEPAFDDQIRTAARMRLRNLAVLHREMEHATITVSRSSEGEEPAQFQACVIMHTPVDALAVTKKDFRLIEALDKALAEIEQQIHERY